MKTSEVNPMSSHEKEQQEVIIENIAPDGLGFGEGGISVRRQMELGILTAEVPEHVNELLMHDRQAFKKVEASDDGCGDGRPWVKIMRMVDSEGMKQAVEYKRSLLRPKVFGGGLVVAASMWRAVNGVPNETSSLIADRQLMAEGLEDYGLSHGAHTDNHAEGDKCGCGAIDNYPVATANAVKYRTQITDTLKAVYGDDFTENSQAIEDVFAVYENLAENQEYFAESNGRQAMEQIIDAGATVKELYGHHVEETIVINEVEDTTLDQQYFTQKVKDMSTNKPQIVQAFTVDVWRGQQLADVVVQNKIQQDPTADATHVYKVAMADFFIRTLAVAGTLTAGDLPVYRRRLAE